MLATFQILVLTAFAASLLYWALPARLVEGRRAVLLVTSGVLIWIYSPATLFLAVATALGRVAPLPYLAAATSFAVALLVRSRRWRRLTAVEGGTRLGSRDALALILAASAINALLPGRAGDLYRIVESGRRGGISRSRSAGAAFIERVLDLAVLGALFLLTSALLFGEHLPDFLAGAVLFAALLLIAGTPLLLLPGSVVLDLLARIPLPGRLHTIATELAHGGFASVHRRTIVMLLSETAGGWIAERTSITTMVLIGAVVAVLLAVLFDLRPRRRPTPA